MSTRYRLEWICLPVTGLSGGSGLGTSRNASISLTPIGLSGEAVSNPPEEWICHPVIGVRVDSLSSNRREWVKIGEGHQADAPLVFNEYMAS